MESALESVQTFHIQIISVVVSVLLIAGIVELIRRGKLREEYSLIWFAAALVFVYFSIWRHHMEVLAQRMGIAYAPALLILLTIFFGSVWLIHFSVVVSRLTDENKRLAQELAILGTRVRDLTPPPEE
ncbi:MAG: DUF2304 domain-containing protein [Candidatus Krumholzibacteria bacterium]